MSNAFFLPPAPLNEPVLSYAPGSPERAALRAELARQQANPVEITSIIGGQRLRTGGLQASVCPHDHQRVLGQAHQIGPAEVQQANDAALRARPVWSNLAWQDRAAVFLRAAELLAGPWRSRLNAATMLGQSKNPFQAEIDSACELIDFFRFNAWYLRKIYEEQPLHSPQPTWNRLEHRPLEGFVFAVTPFNFTSIAGNLPTAPALMGNTVVWKPARSALYSAYWIMELLQAAGLPDGVINLVLGSGQAIGERVLASRSLSGIHFTGSTATFNSLWRGVADRLETYASYPRLVGETGGKDFIFVHESFSSPADLEILATAMVRGAFEYQGQKCSAASRAYIPRSVWRSLKDPLISLTNGLTMGDVNDFGNFCNAVIDEAAYETILGFIAAAQAAPDATILAGGTGDKTVGYFIRPTLIETTNPHFKTMVEEIFGPVLTIFVYEDAAYAATLDLCDASTPYALTGAFFARDRAVIAAASDRLRYAAGNFYINDKPTGAVVGQQPFGGARASGTNDKAGSPLNLMRWVSPRAIKENFAPPSDYRYPFMTPE